MSCLRDWSISRMKPCRQGRDRAQRNSRWQQPNNVSSCYSSGDGATSTSAGVIDTRTLGNPKSFIGQTAEWTTWQFTFKAFACVAHPKMKEVFDLAARKGSEAVVDSDMTAELQSLSTPLYYMLVMMLSEQALEIVRNTSEGNGAEYGASCFGNTSQVLVSNTEQCCHHCSSDDLVNTVRQKTWHEGSSHLSVTCPSMSSSPAISSAMQSSTELFVEALHTKV